MTLEIGYLFHNRRRMDYAAHRQLGLPIGSGAIESACKTVVQARMKQAGMRWHELGHYLYFPPYLGCTPKLKKGLTAEAQSL